MYRSGVLQQNADALSRMKGLSDADDQDNHETDGHMKDVVDLYHLSEVITLEEVREVVQEDLVLHKIRAFIIANHKPDKQERKPLTRAGLSYVNLFEKLSVQDGVVYFRPPEVNGIKEKKRICLPLTLQDSAL